VEFADGTLVGEYVLDMVINCGFGAEHAGEIYEDDLKLARLLIETVGVEHLNESTFLSILVFATCWGPPFVPPALEYLCKQDKLDFNLKTIMREACPPGDKRR